MKDSIGGGLLLGIASMILLIFIIFVCFFINYGVTFKTKNRIINYIEQHEGINDIGVDSLFDSLKTKGYTRKTGSKPDVICYQKVLKSTETIGIIYKVSLHMTFDKTILKESGPLNLSIPISGETKMITTGACFESEENMQRFCIGNLKKCL